MTHKRLTRFLIIIFIGVAGLIMLFNYEVKQGKNFPKVFVSSTSVKPDSLGGVVEKALEGTQGSYGVAVKNLTTDESYFANEHTSFKAGSLYKLWILATAYQKIQDGSLQKNQVLSDDVAVLNKKFDIDPDSAELKDGTVSLTVEEALTQMITISHNYAALLLTEKIKLSTMAAFLKSNGFGESTVGINGDLPTTTAFDMALYFEKLYKGELASQENTKNMLDLLKNQQNKEKLPKYLPQEIAIAHKTGEVDFFSHDAGIIYLPQKAYIMVILSESEFPQAANDRIAQVSKAVYDYFLKKN